MDVKDDRWTKGIFQTLGDRKTLGTDKTLPKETLIEMKIECHYVDLLLNLPIGSKTLPTLPAENRALGSSADVNSFWGRDTAAGQLEAPGTAKFLLLSIPGAEKLVLACCPLTAGLLCLWVREIRHWEHGRNQRSFSPVSVLCCSFALQSHLVHPAWAQKQHLPQWLSRH